VGVASEEGVVDAQLVPTADQQQQQQVHRSWCGRQ
jgi:hypothetical protein